MTVFMVDPATTNFMVVQGPTGSMEGMVTTYLMEEVEQTRFTLTEAKAVIPLWTSLTILIV